MYINKVSVLSQFWSTYLLFSAFDKLKTCWLTSNRRPQFWWGLVTTLDSQKPKRRPPSGSFDVVYCYGLGKNTWSRCNPSVFLVSSTFNFLKSWIYTPISSELCQNSRFSNWKKQLCCEDLYFWHFVMFLSQLYWWICKM